MSTNTTTQNETVNSTNQTNQTNRTLTRIEVDSGCYETYPCKHDMIFHYSDNTSERRCKFSTFITENNYLHLVEPVSMRAHLSE